MEKTKNQEENFRMSTSKLDEMLAIQKTLKDKSGLGFEIGDCLHQKTEDQVKDSSSEKIEVVQLAKGMQIQNQKEKSSIEQPNDQR